MTHLLAFVVGMVFGGILTKALDDAKDPLEVLSDVWIGLSDFNKRNKEKKGGDS